MDISSETAIREFDKSEIEDAIAIYSQSLSDAQATFQTKAPTPEVWDIRHREVCRLAAYDSGKMVGRCALSPFSQLPTYDGVAEVSLYIDKEYRRRGIGSALLRLQCDESEKCGLWTLYSSIFPENTASIKIHEKCGFRLIGRHEKLAKDLFGNRRDTVIFERRSKVII